MAFRKVFKNKKIWIYGGGSLATFLSLLFTLAYLGVQLQTSGDIMCAGTPNDPCISYFNITSLNYTICMGSTFQGITLSDENSTYEIFKADMRYRIDNPNRWKPYNFTSGSCLDWGKTHEFMIKGYKKSPYDKVKWGINTQGKDIDPIWEGLKQEQYNVYDKGGNLTDIRYKIKFENITITTPINTQCEWDANKPLRHCYQDIELEYMRNTALSINSNINFTGQITNKQMKNFKVTMPSSLSKGNNYTVRIEFDYPANTGEEWNFSLNALGYEWKIDPSISVCSSLMSAGIYLLTSSISNNGLSICMNMTVSDTWLDCQGNIIDGTDTVGNAGIKMPVGLTNNSVYNCIVTDWYNGIYALGSRTIVYNINSSSNSYAFHIEGGQNSNFTNLSSTVDSRGLFLETSSNNNIFNFINISGPTSEGIYAAGPIHNNKFLNINISKSSFEGVKLINGRGNVFTNCTIESNKYGGFLLQNISFTNISNCIIRNNSGSIRAGINLVTITTTSNSSKNLIWNNIINNTPNGGKNWNTTGINYTNYFNTTQTVGTNIIGGSNIGGNYWSDYTGTDANSDGFGDTTYIINATYMNDSLPLVPISPDLIPPIVTIISPLNNSIYSTSIIGFNISLDEAGSNCLAEVNKTANITMTKQTDTKYFNLTFTAGEGTHTVRFYCNDAFSNMNYSGINKHNFTYVISRIEWSQNSTNNTKAGNNITFSILWNSTVKSAGNLSSFIFGWRNGINWSQLQGSGDKEAGEQSFTGVAGIGSQALAGYYTIGATNGYFCNAWYVGGNITANATGTVSSTGVYLTVASTQDCKMAIYSDAKVLLGNSTEKSITATGWQEFVYPTPVSVTNNTPYNLIVWCGGGSSQDTTKYGTGTGTGTGWYYRSLAYGEWANPGGYTTSTGRIQSEYMNITSGEGGAGDNESNKTAVEYANVMSDTVYTNIDNITIVVNVTYYNASGSDIQKFDGNKNISLWLQLYNSASYVEIGDFNVTGTGNFSFTTTNANVLSAWQTAANRDVKIIVVWVNYNDTGHIDTINWTQVFVYINSNQYYLNDTVRQFQTSNCPGKENYTCWSNVTKVINSVEGAEILWYVWANDTLNPSNENMTSIFNFTTTGEVGTTGLKYDIGIPFSVLRFTFGLDNETYPAQPDNQSATKPAINATNNGTLVSEFEIRTDATPAAGWALFACNATATDPYNENNTICTMNLSTEWMPIWGNVATGIENKSIFLYANISFVNSNPGCNIEMRRTPA